jgi:cyclophilin family peptidyl-prolyl cis-trans isomerase
VKPVEKVDRKKIEKDAQIRESLERRKKTRMIKISAVAVVIILIGSVAGVYMYQQYKNNNGSNKGTNGGSGGGGGGGTGNIAIISTTLGVIRIQLDTANAPNTAGNFIKLAKASYFNGLVFHRVVKDFVVQGGGMYPDGTQKTPPQSIPWENTGLRNLKYTIAMARSGNPDTVEGSGTATSQFFINTADNGGLDSYQYPFVVFGKVIDGLAVVNAINALTVGTHYGMSDWPDNAPVINSVVIQ